MNLTEGEKDLMNETLLTSSINNLTAFHGNGTYYEEEDQLYEVPVSIVILLSLLYGAISIAALIGNFLVLWVVSVKRDSSLLSFSSNSMGFNLFRDDTNQH
jgi:hypothetical protein